MIPQQQDFSATAGVQQVPLCPPESTLWMGDLKPEWDANFIREAFGENAADITNVKLRNTYCFVEFRDDQTARTAMLRVNGMTLPNDPSGTSRFNLAFANSPHHMSIEYNLFVNNLAPDVDDVALFRLFGERYMSCRGAKVYRHEDGSSKEQGFVRFTSETDQQRALVELNKHKFHNRELFLKLARPKARGGPNERRYGGGHGGQGLLGPGYPNAGGFGKYFAFLLFHSPPAPMQTMPMMGTVPYGMAGTAMALATPYGAQLAPNHGMAGFGSPATGQQFGGQPLMVGNAYPPNAFMHPFQPAHIIHPGPMTPIGGPVPVIPMNQKLPVKLDVPIQYEEIEPLSPEEHNAILYNSSAEFHTFLEASRWNAVGFLPDTRKKELFNMLHQ